jgi:hypothetical protein
VAQRLNRHFMERSLEKLTMDIKVSLLEMARLSAPLNVESPSEELSPVSPFNEQQPTFSCMFHQ